MNKKNNNFSGTVTRIIILLLLINCYAEDITKDPKIMESLNKLPFSSTHYLDGENSELVTSMEQTYNIVHYIYGGSRMLTFKLNLQESDSINTVIWYNVILASADYTSIKIEAVLKKSKNNEIILGEHSFTIDTNNFVQYLNYFSLTEPVKIDSGDLFILRITGKGSDFGIYFGPRESRIIFLKPAINIEEAVLKE